MEEKYLCESCKNQQSFFAMYCSVTDKECPIFCTECEDYEEAEDTFKNHENLKVNEE